MILAVMTFITFNPLIWLTTVCVECLCVFVCVCVECVCVFGNPSLNLTPKQFTQRVYGMEFMIS